MHKNVQIVPQSKMCHVSSSNVRLVVTRDEATKQGAICIVDIRVRSERFHGLRACTKHGLKVPERLGEARALSIPTSEGLHGLFASTPHAVKSDERRLPLAQPPLLQLHASQTFTMFI